jgi:hypothetical protein
MTELVCSPKIRPGHLARRAIVYLRQSSEKQVRQKVESQRLQYEVAERIRALGWNQVETIDSDFGASASMASARREGFERVLSAVALAANSTCVTGEAAAPTRVISAKEIIDDGGQYCVGFGGASVDRRLSQELLRVISPLGVNASLRALEELSAGDAAQRIALTSKLDQLQYEARKAFEQYDAVDARNRLVAGELERRWNEKLEGVETTKQRLANLNRKRYSLPAEEETRILAMGENFSAIWQSDHCPPALKKMIFRTVVEEIIVRTNSEKKTVQFTVHWKGGTHTELTMERPRSATDCATSMEALEVIRRMAARHGDDQIASVLNRLGYSTGKSKRWNQTRVATARRNYSISGQRRALPDPDAMSLSEAARICGVSHSTIARLVKAGLLKSEQVTPRSLGNSSFRFG